MNNKNKLSRTFAYILHQTWNERRSNWALLAELLIVSCVVWYLTDMTYNTIVRRNEPLGFDITNCYQLQIGHLDGKAVGYDPSHPDSADIMIGDRLTLIDRVRHLEDIEAAAYSARNSPFNSTSMWAPIKYDTLEITPNRLIICQPDFMRVFRIGSVDGKSPEQMANLLNKKTLFMSDARYKNAPDLSKLLGKELESGFSYDSTRIRLTALTAPLKRYTWEKQEYSNVAILYFENHLLNDFGIDNMDIRVKANRTQGFEDRMRELIKGKKLRVGNHYISSFTSYDQLRTDSEGGTERQQRFTTIGMAFLLINVFLGLLGTFWFRTQHRFKEIGLQKAIGATNPDIVLRLFAEAVLLMTIAFIPSLLIDTNIAYAGLTEEYQGNTLAPGRFIICAAISYLLMLLVIALGIWFPAQKAVKANPVEVLRGE